MKTWEIAKLHDLNYRNENIFIEKSLTTAKHEKDSHEMEKEELQIEKINWTKVFTAIKWWHVG